jgi:hypothetical protein
LFFKVSQHLAYHQMSDDVNTYKNARQGVLKAWHEGVLLGRYLTACRGVLLGRYLTACGGVLPGRKLTAFQGVLLTR